MDSVNIMLSENCIFINKYGNENTYYLLTNMEMRILIQKHNLFIFLRL